MTVHTQKTSFIKVILIAFTAFVLSACRVEGTLEFKADGSTKFMIELEDTTDAMKKINQTCKGIELSTRAKAKIIKNPKFEDLTSQRGHITCRVSTNEPFDSDKVKLTTDGDKYIFFMPKITIGYDWSDTKTNIVVSMPGKVIKTTKGKIDGSKVVLDSLDFFNDGIRITAEKEGASNTSASSGESTRPSNEKTGAASSRNEGGDGFPAWGWGLIGGGILAVIAGAWLILGRKRRTARTSAGTSQTPVAPSTLPQQAQPHAPGPQAANPTPYPHNAQTPPPSGYGHNTPPTTPHAPNPTHTQNDPSARFRPQ